MTVCNLPFFLLCERAETVPENTVENAGSPVMNSEFKLSLH